MRQFTIHPLTQERQVEAAKLLADEFNADPHTWNNAVKTPWDETSRWFREQYVPERAREGHSFVAVCSATRECVGALTVETMQFGVAHRELDTGDFNGTHVLVPQLDALFYGARPDAKTGFHAYMGFIAVHTAWRGTDVARALSAKAVAESARRGCGYAVGHCESLVSASLARKIGFEPVGRIVYADFQVSGGERPFASLPDCATVVALNLEPVRNEQQQQQHVNRL